MYSTLIIERKYNALKKIVADYEKAQADGQPTFIEIEKAVKDIRKTIKFIESTKTDHMDNDYVIANYYELNQVFEDMQYDDEKERVKIREVIFYEDEVKKIKHAFVIKKIHVKDFIDQIIDYIIYEDLRI